MEAVLFRKAYMRRLVVLLSFGAILFGPLTVFASYNQTSAESYLTAHASNPWSTMALAMLNSSSIPSDYLKTINGTTAIEYAAPILAITALGQDPRTFGDKDLIAELEKFHTSNQIGDTATINDDIFGLFALLSAGVPNNDPTIIDAENFILAHQQANGGWGFATSGGTDSNMTSAAIVALIADGVLATDTKIQNALDYLKTAQNADGGFTYDPQSQFGTDSDSSSTAWVLWALNAAKINPDDWTKPNGSPTSYLESNQVATGFFKYQSISTEDSFSATTTAYAVMALNGKTLPLNIFTAPIPTFTLTYIAGPNGSLTGSASQTVSLGADGTAVTAVAVDGFHFSNWSDGVLAAARTDTNVSTNISATANFVVDLKGGGGWGGGGIFCLDCSTFVPSTTVTSAPTPNPTPPNPTPIPTNPPGQVLGTTAFASGTLVKTTNDATVYIVENEKYRPFSNELTFLTRGLRFSDVQIIDSNLISTNNFGKIMGFADGILIKGSSATVYMILKNTKLGFVSMGVLSRMKLSLDNVVEISDADLASYDDGEIMQ